MPQIPSPEKTDAANGEYALVMYDEGEALFQYEQPVDWQDSEWVLKQEFAHDEVPPLNLQEASLHREHNGSALAAVTVYAKELSSTTRGRQGNGEERNGYWATIEGAPIPETGAHYQQKDSMEAVVNHLIEQHGLLDSIELPYVPEWASNCTMNETPEHPDGTEMRAPVELVSGDYLHTSLNRQQKEYRIKNLAKQVDAERALKGSWEE